ncbi:succinate dehydrogenase/fumarate reductase flavoprotein subunit [Rhodococcus fascians]|uniref:3-ketosteroid-delta-1-dehydrogenase n=1 Tax=Nocardiaceae TaxID=85025 RepID=UPI0028590AB7|nr:MULTISPECIES: 3-ketosteroid-delta-1-dehydrogenase [Rhodococcus]MDR6910731.1 succinate dehydrogenase/fumarate reductase flavoprotein subunit [Rhodococcus sp. 3258]MDR6931902.1 succinate dehydrogenase/fumarate reductase flavoprotein subunit [Rhodococcus fascians]
MGKKMPSLEQYSAVDTEVDLVVIGSGTGMAAALAAHELGLSVLIVEKTQYVGGSTARSGGAFWLPANKLLTGKAGDSRKSAGDYVRAVVGDSAPRERGEAFLDNSAATMDMLSRTTPMKFFWAEGYSDYHPELDGGTATGRTCECKPFDMSVLGSEIGRLRPGLMEAGLPMPVTGADYKWMNLLVRKPGTALPKILKRLATGVGGLIIGRRYVAGGQALAAGMFAGVLKAGIPVWTETTLVRLVESAERVTGAVVSQGGREVTVTARKGVILATGGFDHDIAMRRKFQSDFLTEDSSLGADGNTGDGIRIGQDLGADIDLMDQSWWFPAVAPLPGKAPGVLLAERSLPGSFIVDQNGKRFINEAQDYMSFGQRILELERLGSRVESMWLIFDQRYRNSYLMAAELFPRMPIPQAWYDEEIAYKSSDLAGLARSVGLPVETFEATVESFNLSASNGKDLEFHRGDSAYDRYYGDPTIGPNPNLRPLTDGPFYAVKVILSDLGTCGGLRADQRAQVLREDRSVVNGLYAIGNTAANAFGHSYPGAGATIGQGLVFGYLAALEASKN